MLAIRPDRVKVTMDGTEYVTTKVLIGLDGEYCPRTGNIRP